MRSRTDEIAVLFTVGIFTVGLASYLYLRALSTITSVRFELNNCIGSLNELNENMNALYLRAESFVTKEDLGDVNNSSEGMDEEHYQGWEGVAEKDDVDVRVHVIHEQYYTSAKNIDWVTNEDEDNSSVTVRDYYVSSFGSDYDWSFSGNTAILSERMVSGWTSVIRVVFQVTFKDGVRDENKYTELIQKMLDPSLYTWRRLLVVA